MTRDVVLEDKIFNTYIRSCGVILWPYIMFMFVPDKMSHIPACLLPILWVFGAYALDIFLMFHGESSVENKPAGLKIEPSVIFATAFGMCGFIGTKADGPLGHAVIAALIGCVLTAMPSHNLKVGSREEQMFESIQKTIVLWCLGLLVLGVSLSFHDLKSAGLVKPTPMQTT